METSTVRVFVLDTGMYVNHPDLRVMEHVSFVPELADDLNGHGTHVAGIIGARNNSDYVIGVAPGIGLHAIKVLDRNGDGTSATVISGINHVINFKRANPTVPCVINLSLGVVVNMTSYNMIDTACAQAVNEGIVVVVAAGNDSIDARNVSPAHTTEVITVGAYDVYDRLASFSNYGTAIDILAPGSNVLSTSYTGNTTIMSGTSMASPAVAGWCALYLQYQPTATPAQVAQALKLLSVSSDNPSISHTRGTSTTRLSVFVPRRGFV